MKAYYLHMLLFFAFLLFVWVGVWIWGSYRERRLQEKIAHTPFPETYRNLLRKFPYYTLLPDADRTKLQHSILRFIETKEFKGIGLEVTDEMKATIAYYACLPVLHLPGDFCYEQLKTILVYPSDIVLDHVREEGGIYSKERFLIEGQSASDTVVLAWHEVKAQAYHLRRNNVVIHEFAHEIDFIDGMADGVPPMEKSLYDAWVRHLFGTYERLRQKAMQNRAWGKYKLLGEYAATNEAEFFAVVSERFFESPETLKKHFPELYETLKAFYRLDPYALLHEEAKRSDAK